MQNKDTIPFEHWSLKVGRADPVTRIVAPFMGEIVSAVDDLHQSISNLILTPLGAVPTEPEKGCDVMPYIDRHADEAIPNVTRAIWDALLMWEPRIVVQDIKVTQAAYAHFECAIYWRPVESVLDDLIVTQVALKDQSKTDRRVA
jgi:phage baseplate assembly protein W